MHLVCLSALAQAEGLAMERHLKGAKQELDQRALKTNLTKKAMIH
jgi:hypothetical protein